MDILGHQQKPFTTFLFCLNFYKLAAKGPCTAAGAQQVPRGRAPSGQAQKGITLGQAQHWNGLAQVLHTRPGYLPPQKLGIPLAAQYFMWLSVPLLLSFFKMKNRTPLVTTDYYFYNFFHWNVESWSV